MEFKLINLYHLPLREQEACMTKQLRDQVIKKKKEKREKKKGDKSNIKEVQGCIINQKWIRKFTKLLVCLSSSDTSQSQIQLLLFRML